MDKNKIKTEKRARRRKKIRVKIAGTALAPRLSVFKSNSHIYAQLVDDDSQKTLVAVSSRELKKGKALLNKKTNKTLAAREAGRLLAGKALGRKLKKAVFDRGGYVYAGRVKALADGAREGGLNF
ncbi:MAG: 50S ribosomal protein L18 [Candidatus Taylorbacteria bacterium]|nr:50S ribosomal protein L18 [Candidatus Taylorbacteria bacterium]